MLGGGYARASVSLHEAISLKQEYDDLLSRIPVYEAFCATVLSFSGLRVGLSVSKLLRDATEVEKDERRP